jgi:hypothetical protein
MEGHRDIREHQDKTNGSIQLQVEENKGPKHYSSSRRKINNLSRLSAYYPTGVLYWIRLKTSTELYVEDASVSKTTGTS